MRAEIPELPGIIYENTLIQLQLSGITGAEVSVESMFCAYFTRSQSFKQIGNEAEMEKCSFPPLFGLDYH